MSLTEFSREWTGSYDYGAFADGPETQSVGFRMRFSIGWFGRFSGSIDDGDGGIPERANIWGRFSGNRVKFKKCYPHTWTTTGDGKLMVIPQSMTQVIYYEGDLSDDFSRLIGVWSVRAGYFTVGNLRYKTPESAGTWNAVADALKVN